jgi:hypothetical protein
MRIMSPVMMVRKLKFLPGAQNLLILPLLLSNMCDEQLIELTAWFKFFRIQERDTRSVSAKTRFKQQGSLLQAVSGKPAAFRSCFLVWRSRRCSGGCECRLPIADTQILVWVLRLDIRSQLCSW